MAVSPEAIGWLADAPPLVLDRILELNRRNVELLSELDSAGLARLIGKAFHATLIGEGAAFLLAFDQDAEYHSPNFQWFHSRYPRFVYVDRIAVAPSARGQGLASRLYWNLFEAAAVAGHSIITCEINLDPPNPTSDRLHEAHGFQEVGRADLGTGKTVRYLTRQLATDGRRISYG